MDLTTARPILTDLLAEVHKAAGSGIIAGGAIRDLYLGKPIKDWDLFVPGAGVNAVKTALGLIEDAEVEQSEPGDADHILNQSILRFPGLTEPINLIGLRSDDPVTVGDQFARFDFGLAMTAFDGVEYVLSTPFLDDVGDRAITLIHATTPEALRQSLYRYWRYHAKYPWPLRFAAPLPWFGNLGPKEEPKWPMVTPGEDLDDILPF